MLFHISVHDQHVHNDVAAFCGWHVLRFLMLFHISVHDQHVHNDVAAFCLWLTCTSQCGTFFIYLMILIYLMIWLLLTCTSQCGTFLYILWFSYTWWYGFFWHVLHSVAPFYISRDSHILDDTASFDMYFTVWHLFIYISWFSYTWWYGFFWSACGCQVLLLFHLFATNTECHFMFLWSAHHILSSVVTFCLSFADKYLTV